MSDQGPASFHCGEQTAATWGVRAAAAAALLAELSAARREGATLADIGCGDGKLRDALRARGLGIRWQGYDLHPQAAEVTRFDVRSEQLPQPVAVAALLGVADYLPDLPQVLAALADRAESLVASHVVRDDRLYPPDRRRELGWVNHVDADAFVQLLSAAGWRVLARRRTDEGRTQIVLCERAAARAPAAALAESPFAVLSPYLMPPALQGRKAVNLGDGFILRAIERCLGRFAPARTLTSRAAPSSAEQAALDAAGTVVLAGANQLHDEWTLWPGLDAERLRATALRLVPFGIGLHGDPGRNDGMSPATRALLREVHARIPLSSWRCSRTVAYLRRELPELADRFVMTGCPVLYDAPLLDGVAFAAGEARVAVTVTERGDFAAREEAVLAFAARRFRHARRYLVLHQNWSPPTRWELWRHRWWPRADARLDPYQRLRRVAVRAGFEVVCPRDADEAIAFYGTVDAHLGSRLHAHLLCLSRAKRSWLVPVDGRALGIAEDLGFPLGDPQRLEAVMDCDFDAVRARARMYHADMRRFLATLQR
jgi:hypothetical protein